MQFRVELDVLLEEREGNPSKLSTERDERGRSAEASLAECQVSGTRFIDPGPAGL